ncbi:MAG: hypothetical protein ACRD1R_06560 [Acidobacteriota bacterium]
MRSNSVYLLVLLLALPGAFPPAAAQPSPAANIRVSEGQEIWVELLDSLSTERNSKGDKFRSKTVQDVKLNGRVVIPKGTRVLGEVSFIKRAGRIAGRAEMNLRFDELHLENGARVPIRARLVSLGETADEQEEEGTISSEGTKGKDAKKIGAATAIGALLGVLTGGKKGAATGSAIGAVVGLAGVLATRGGEIELVPETQLRIRLMSDAVISERALQ